jgi:phenylalanyl-tRNA synthetase beta chain
MDLKLPYSWIKEHLVTRATPAEFAKYLSLCGPSIERVTKLDKDSLFHIEVTTNRIDMASVIGIAREANAILPHFGLKTKLLTPETTKAKLAKSQKRMTVTDHQKLSQRTIGVVVEEITNWQTPRFISDRLEACGVRSLNAPVDITNYVMSKTTKLLSIKPKKAKK